MYLYPKSDIFIQNAKIELKSNIVERDVKHHNPLNISGFGKHLFLLSGYT
jgi:hypothetical protein